MINEIGSQKDKQKQAIRAAAGNNCDPGNIELVKPRIVFIGTQLDEFEANLKGTEAQEPVALVIKQVRLIYKALKQGDLNQAKVLLKSLDAVGQQIENKIREAGNNRAAM